VWRIRPSPQDDAQPPVDAVEAALGRTARKKAIRRKAGCVWGCLTEPLVLLGATVAALLFGRAYLVRRAQRLREQQAAEEETPGND